tara:strand:+ start:560 stop:904 length:345 start_codon:yes stop_codon:yes gene_type:complete
MATNANWTVVFDDRCIIKNNGAESGTGYVINDDNFWNQSNFSNMWAIQYGTTPSTDEVEHRDETPHATWASTGLDFQPFIDKWDAAHLEQLQANWDADDRDESEKGPRPTSYSS